MQAADTGMLANIGIDWELWTNDADEHVAEAAQVWPSIKNQAQNF